MLLYKGVNRMFSSLATKIEYEYTNFYNFMTTMSKHDIYAKSREIECKKCIRKTLKQKCLFPPDQEQKLMTRINLMAEIYSMMDTEIISKESVMQCVEKILYSPA